ncbi:hypothetical protein GPUN_1885 [Glaciecola punicea ACAM 611]|uniref:Uncharacterized protein n=1 Tax=Glaciecola punicea ACAM 611 TaxID=1121923 RepID=H5TCH4_9ALTE|nr:hypothetical protein BAE46_06550 [Glaciecola punicea]GAB56001.1 hypothetical protein GPUN_1885 [Glaciecola punicea ACAM 611]
MVQYDVKNSFYIKSTKIKSTVLLFILLGLYNCNTAELINSRRDFSQAIQNDIALIKEVFNAN